MALKSLLGSDARVREAATVPFMSMQMGKDIDTFAVALLQASLKQVEVSSWFLPPRLLPRSRVNGKRVDFRWGPFLFERDELDKRVYGGGTLTAVCKFQRQDGLEVDGKAGMITLGRLDEILHYIEHTAPPDVVPT